ncbi:MAG: hypothetical protein ACREMJ_08475, partial [Gemmatimonadales bacterium]
TLGALVLAATSLDAQRRSTVITAEEIEEARPHVGTAFDAVQTLRPRWLRARDVIFSGRENEVVQVPQVHVYLHDVDMGDVTYLKTILAERVYELRFLGANQAASRFGPTAGPVIVVTLKR